MSEAVLIVSHGESSLATHTRLLESSGFTVLTASTLQDGLRVFQSRPVGAVVVDGTLLVNDNHNHTAGIKRLKPRVPVIVTGECQSLAKEIGTLIDAMVLKAQESDFFSFRLKPLIKVRSHSHSQLEQKYVVFADASRRYLDCSDDVCQLLGYTRMEIIGMTIDDVSYRPEKTLGLFDEYRRKGALDGQYILKHKTGKPLFIRYRSYIFPDGCMAAVWETIEDWKQLYQAAMLETDGHKLKERVELAHAAVEERVLELAPERAKNPQEWQQLNDARTGLRVLRREITK